MKKKVLLLLVAILMVTSIVLMFQVRSLKEEPPKITSELINNRLEEVNELISLDYHYTNMGQFENQNDFYGWKVPFTKKQFIVTYDGKISCGINAKDITVEIKDDTVRFIVPQAEVISHEIFEDSLQVFDEKNSIFNPITVSDYNDFQMDQKDKVQSNAIEAGLLEKATDRAVELVKDLTSFIKDISPDVQIIVERQVQAK